jgi:two-component system, response regulator PdtaR
MVTVCILEDDLILRLDAATLLQEAGFDVVEFASADLAFSYLAKSHADVCMLFADIRLPGMMDGMTLAKEVARRWPSIRLVLTSGATTPDDGDVPKTVIFMPKPWHPSSVLAHAMMSRGF